MLGKIVFGCIMRNTATDRRPHDNDISIIPWSGTNPLSETRILGCRFGSGGGSGANPLTSDIRRPH